MDRKILSQLEKSTLLEEYKRVWGDEVKVFTEQEHEESLIKTLLELGYEYRPDIKSEEDLIRNLRIQLERLNSQRIKDFRFTDEEWEDFLSKYINGSQNFGIENRAERIHTSKCQVTLNRSYGNSENIWFIDKSNPDNNFLQVINKYRDTEASCKYNVTILVNGLPMVQIEIKKEGVQLKEAFYQMDRCRRDALSSCYRLFEFIQIFIITNGTDTKYYSNTTQKFKGERGYHFTSFWTDSKNRKIKELLDFALSFLHPRVIRRIIAKYCVFSDWRKLEILRPYQIEAVERIKDKIETSINHKLPLKESGGFIWHTCGSGKSLTSFKAAQMALEIPEVQRVLYLVDGRDLERRICMELENYQNGILEKYTWNPRLLKEKLMEKTKDEKVIVTTTQTFSKLFIESGWLKNKFFDEKIVIFIDKCHRKRSRVIRDYITKHFKNASIFGFTGTPIIDSEDKTKNTEYIFGELLHSYRICDAINDENILPFLYEKVEKLLPKEWKKFTEKRRKRIVEWILGNFSFMTQNGFFNSIFAVSSRQSALEYQRLFEELQRNKKNKLTVEVFFAMSGGELNREDRYLDKVLQKQGNQNLNEYYSLIYEKMKDRKIDILIVVDMFLDDFISPTLNTLWVDKNLEDHELIAAFSRTNRIFNDSKEYGNIVSFRDLEENMKDAFNKYTKYGIRKNDDEINLIIPPFFDEYYSEYRNLWKNVLEKKFPLSEENMGIQNESDVKIFCKVFIKFLSLENNLKRYSEFQTCERLGDVVVQNYKTKYLDIKYKIKTSKKLKASK